YPAAPRLAGGRAGGLQHVHRPGHQRRPRQRPGQDADPAQDGRRRGDPARRRRRRRQPGGGWLMLVAQGLRKTYRSREVVRDFGMALVSCEVVGLLGPNGAGKTRCFYMIVGLVPADAGQITLDGKDITGDPMYVRAKYGVGYLPQEPSVFRKLSVADNIMTVLELRDDLDKAGREREL